MSTTEFTFVRLATGSFLIWNTPCSKLSGVNNYWSTLQAGHAVKERFTAKNFTTYIREVSLGSWFTKRKTLQYT